MNDDTNTLSDFDNLILGDKLTLFKILIPYVDYRKQMLFAILIRILEFKLTLDFYSNPNCCYRNSKHGFNTDFLLNDLKNHCPPKYKGMLEQMSMIMSMSEYMDIFSKADDIMGMFENLKPKEKSDSGNTDTGSPVDFLKGMLSKEQQEMLEHYNNILNNE